MVIEETGGDRQTVFNKENGAKNKKRNKQLGNETK